MAVRPIHALAFCHEAIDSVQPRHIHYPAQTNIFIHGIFKFLRHMEVATFTSFQKRERETQ